MKLAVLGGTGNCGQAFLPAALEAGHEVVALVRDPAKIKQENDNLTVVRVDIFSEASLAAGFEGCDAVVSCLGFKPRRIFAKLSAYSESIIPITNAMLKASVSRLVAVTCWGTVPGGSRSMYLTALKPLSTLYGSLLPDMRKMEVYLEESCPDINYTILRIPWLRRRPLDSRQLVIKESGNAPGGIFVPYPNFAKLALDVLDTPQWDRKMIAFAMPN